MFKRAMWMGAGFGAGVGATVWADVKLRRAAQRLTPGALGDEVAARVRSLRQDVREAVVDGRQAMARREAELRAVRPAPAVGDRLQARSLERRAPAPAFPGAPAQTEAGPVAPPVPWSDHGHERASSRLS